MVTFGAATYDFVALSRGVVYRACRLPDGTVDLGRASWGRGWTSFEIPPTEEVLERVGQSGQAVVQRPSG